MSAAGPPQGANCAPQGQRSRARGKRGDHASAGDAERPGRGQRSGARCERGVEIPAAAA